MTTQTGTNPINPAVFNVLTTTPYVTKNYEVVVGFLKDGELPQYAVRNRQTQVIEFNNEVLSFVREWLTHFQERLDDLDSGKAQVEAPTQKIAFNS